MSKNYRYADRLDTDWGCCGAHCWKVLLSSICHLHRHQSKLSTAAHVSQALVFDCTGS